MKIIFIGAVKFFISRIKKNYLISLSLIITRGAGNEKHLIKGLMADHINVVATANLFNFIGNSQPDARSGIIFNNGNIAQWQ
jgi:hypothetical protein